MVGFRHVSSNLHRNRSPDDGPQHGPVHAQPLFPRCGGSCGKRQYDREYDHPDPVRPFPGGHHPDCPLPGCRRYGKSQPGLFCFPGPESWSGSLDQPGTVLFSRLLPRDLGCPGRDLDRSPAVPALDRAFCHRAKRVYGFHRLSPRLRTAPGNHALLHHHESAEHRGKHDPDPRPGPHPLPGGSRGMHFHQYG